MRLTNAYEISSLREGSCGIEWGSPLRFAGNYCVLHESARISAQEGVELFQIGINWRSFVLS
jgi:hypothetical protein